MSEQMTETDDEIDLSLVPIRALSLSTRHQLSQYLNGQQYISTASGLSRDYRGIAQLMGFPYSVINSILRSTDPFNSLLEIYQNKSEAHFKRLLEMIEQIERYDIIDDMTPVLIKDAKHYLKGNHFNQVSEKSPEIDSNKLSLQLSQPMVNYDAYICYADNDLPFVQNLSQFLETPKLGLRLFIRDRDLSLGSWAYESFAQVIDHQCRKVLIVLSPDFLNCPECGFQTMFATGLAIEQRNRKLIPIIYKKCELPPIIRMLTKIDMTRSSDTKDWSWNRLVTSIKNDVINNSIVYRQNSRLDSPSLHELPSVPMDSPNEMTDKSLMTLPSICPQPTAPPLVSTQSSICSSINSETSDKSYTSESDPIFSSDNKKSLKKVNQKKWIQTLNPFKQKFKS